MIVRSMLRLSHLLDQGARLLRHLAQRRDDRRQSAPIDRDPLGRFLAEFCQVPNNVGLDSVNGEISAVSIDEREGESQFAERAGHQVLREFEDSSFVIRHAYLAWCRQQNETPWRLRAQAEGVAI